MATTSSFLRIKPVAFNYQHEADSSITLGEAFSCTKPFYLFSSHAIKPGSKTYMEFTITVHPTNKQIRHLPLYVGVAKEPSRGIFVNDFIAGSLYYTLDTDYEIVERAVGDVSFVKQDVPRLYSRIPIVNSVIGIGVDPTANMVTIYVDGNKFYSFSPKKVNLRDGDSWYFFIYNNLYETIYGKVNFGRYKVEYLPPTYCTLYQDYYTYSEIEDSNNPDINPSDIGFDCVLEIPGVALAGDMFSAFTGKVDVENAIAPVERDQHRIPYLIHNKANMNYGMDIAKGFQMQARPIPDMTTINYPCPVQDRVYLEFSLTDCTLEDKYEGLPIVFGISDQVNDISSKAFTVDLFHYQQTSYWTHSYVNGVENNYPISKIYSPSVPVQPETVGVLIDLFNKEISFYTNSVLYMKATIRDIDTTDDTQLWYIFFMADNKVIKDLSAYHEVNTLRAEVNYGETLFSCVLPDDCQSFYDYWNSGIRWYLEEPFPGFTVRMKVRQIENEYNLFINCEMKVDSDVDPWEGFTQGLNVLYNTLNIVTDTQPHSYTPMDPFQYYALKDSYLLRFSKKDLSIDGFDCKMEVTNPYAHTWNILGTVVMLVRNYWEFDVEMEVVPYAVVKHEETASISGYVNLPSNDYYNWILRGFVTLE